MNIWCSSSLQHETMFLLKHICVKICWKKQLHIIKIPQNMIKYSQSNLLCTNVFARNATSMLRIYFGTKVATINNAAINVFLNSHFCPEDGSLKIQS